MSHHVDPTTPENTDPRPIKRSKKKLFQHIAANFLESMNGLKIVALENRTLRIIFPFGIGIGLIAVGLTRYISGEWFTVGEWAISIILMWLVAILEVNNSSIEEIGDVADSNYNPKIKRAKDIASADVFLGLVLLAVVVIFFAVCHIVHWPWAERMF